MVRTTQERKEDPRIATAVDDYDFDDVIILTGDDYLNRKIDAELDKQPS